MRFILERERERESKVITNERISGREEMRV